MINVIVDKTKEWCGDKDETDKYEIDKYGTDNDKVSIDRYSFVLFLTTQLWYNAAWPQRVWCGRVILDLAIVPPRWDVGNRDFNRSGSVCPSAIDTRWCPLCSCLPVSVNWSPKPDCPLAACMQCAVRPHRSRAAPLR